MGSSTEAASARVGRFEFDPSTEDGRLHGVLEELCQANEAVYRKRGRSVLPSRTVVAELVEDLRAVLYSRRELNGATLDDHIPARLVHDDSRVIHEGGAPEGGSAVPECPQTDRDLLHAARLEHEIIEARG